MCKLTSLDVSANIALMQLDCQFNQLSTEALNFLFGTLPNTQWDWIYIADNLETDTCNRSIATNKGLTI